MRSTIVLFFILFCCACQKKDNTTPDAGKVAITVTSPQQGMVYKSNDSVSITASVSYPAELHGYEVMITDTATGTILYDKAEHTHTDKFVINEKWACTVAKTTTMKFTLSTVVDHAGTVAKKELFFDVKP
jgi:hypothetical protein